MRPTLDTLSRLKGIETLVLQLKIFLLRALDTLSRLKGIETRRSHRQRGTCRNNYFGYAFPFEGN